MSRRAMTRRMEEMRVSALERFASMRVSFDTLREAFDKHGYGSPEYRRLTVTEERTSPFLDRPAASGTRFDQVTSAFPCGNLVFRVTGQRQVTSMETADMIWRFGEPATVFGINSTAPRAARRRFRSVSTVTSRLRAISTATAETIKRSKHHCRKVGTENSRETDHVLQNHSCLS